MRGLYHLPDKLSAGEIFRGIVEGGIISIGISWLFYRSVFPGCIGLPIVLYFYLKRKKERFVHQRRLQFRGDFKDFSQMMSSFLRAGYSVENAMKKSCEQLNLTRNGCEDLIDMLSCMLREIQIGGNTEQIWVRFCTEIPIEEIRDFGQIFSLSKRSGASLPDVLSRVVNQLDLKIQTEEQIETLVAGKKMEQKIMNIMPAGILIYICVTSGEMMRVMYTTLTGRLVMTVCLLVYIGAFLLSEQITAAF